MDRALGSRWAAVPRAASLLSRHSVSQPGHGLPPDRLVAAAQYAVPGIHQPWPRAFAACAVQQSHTCRSRMTHFGIISPPVPGHIHPFAALGRELISRGHRVTYLQMIDLEEKIRSEG